MSTPMMIDAYLDALLGDSAVLDPVPAVTTLAPPQPVAAVSPVPASGDAPVPPAAAGMAPPAPAPAPPALVPAAVACPVETRAAADARPARPAVRATAPHRGAQPGRWLRVGIGEDRYAVELLRVQEVVRVAPVVAMRGTEPWVTGVMNLRGRIVPVIDLGEWLDAGHVVPDERSRVVVIERNDELIGLLVSAVNDVTTLDASHIEPPLAAGTPGPIVGVARAGDAPTVLLDASALFA